MTPDCVDEGCCNRASYLRSDFNRGKTWGDSSTILTFVPVHRARPHRLPFTAAIEMLRPRQSSVSSLLWSTTSTTSPVASTSSATRSPLPCLPGPSTTSRQSSTSAPRRRPHADRLRHEDAAGSSLDSLLSSSKGASGRQGEALRAKVQVRCTDLNSLRLEYHLH